MPYWDKYSIMPKNQDSLNSELFDFLQSRGYNPSLLDTSGKEIPVPEEAEVFQFEFEKDGENYGTATISIDGLHKLVIYFGDKIADSPKNDGEDGESWYNLLKQFKRFAQKHQLSFEIKNIDRLKYDMAKRDHTKKLDEGYYPMGKKASYNDSVPTTKMIIKHTRNIEEGEQRFRNIDKIFIENSIGERILAPTNKPGLARIYARHIAEGGKPYDERWDHISKMCEEYSKMAGFVRATRNGQFNESAQALVSEGISHYTKLRETLHKLTGRKGYNSYFENFTPTIVEDEVNEDLGSMFTQSTLDPRIESVMPILSKLSKNVTETKFKHVEELEEWADNVIEGRSDEMDDEYDPESDDYAEREAEKADFERDLDKEQKVSESNTPLISQDELDALLNPKSEVPNKKENLPDDVLRRIAANPSMRQDIIAAYKRKQAIKNQGVAEDDNFLKPAGMMKASPQALKTAQGIVQQQADKNVIGQAKIAGTVPSQGVAEGDAEKIGGRHDPVEFDAMVKRLGQQAKKKNVDISSLARRLQAAMKADEKKEKKTDEGLGGAIAGGTIGAALTKTPSGTMTGASIGSDIEDTLTSEDLNKNQQNESIDLLNRFKKLSGL